MVSEDNNIDEERISDVVSTLGGYGKSVSYRELKSYASTNNVNSEKGQLKRKLNQKLKRSLLKGEIQETTPGNYEIVGKGYRAMSRRRSRSRSRRRKTRQMQVCLSVAPSRTRRRKRSRGPLPTRRRRSRTRRVSSRGRRGRKISITKRRRRSSSRSQKRRPRRTSRSRKPRRTSRKRVSRVRKQAEKTVPIE